MKAVILAGGLGTRLAEETHLRPKSMVEVGGKQMLWHILKTYSYYVISELIFCGYQGYIIKGYFANYFLQTSDVPFLMDLSHMKTHSQKASLTAAQSPGGYGSLGLDGYQVHHFQEKPFGDRV